MKFLVLLMALAICYAENEDNADSLNLDSLTEGKYDYDYKDRLCPEGYTYAGEDTNIMNGSLILGGDPAGMTPIYHSKVYSCYKIISVTDGGFNEALTACDKDEAKLVKFEDEGEVDRVMMKMLPLLTSEDGHGNQSNWTTAAMRFADVDEWLWLGTNLSVLFHVTATEDSSVEQCLAVTVDRATLPYRLNQVHFRSVRCNQPGPMDALCEVRVEMVTYMAWFVSNWVTFLLMVMTVLLLSALCVSLFRVKSGRRIYRQGRTPSPAAAPTSNLPYSDAPPTYNDVTGVRNETKMDKYKTKGKDILAKVTFYTKTPSSTPTNNP